MTKNSNNDNYVTIFRHDVIVKFCWRYFISIVKFNYWSKFHVNIITGSGIMTVFFCKGLTRNPEIENAPVRVLPNIWRWDELWIPNLARMSLTECYWMLQTSRVTAFSVSWVIKGKPTGGKGGLKLPSPTPDLGY